ncbi:hypothetical protein [Pedobacter nutrimenti]|jgi:hypothetical protein|uniref:DUF937 domain-containing protein n=1 Tax=Pedobacter nutrimenti TaxID=1241337 RepID=A0A318UIA7_9SPHI|nr:hypothetical protein [Pedobacter nutrimenti]PYF76062.1 hypothetical protein B0O44_102618 [Pedobacter nutrimenti]|eukprot:gene3393-3853_t
MLENLNQLVKESAQDAIVNNSDVPNEHNEAAIQAASGSIFDTLKEQLSSGNIGNLVDAFKGGNVENSAVVQQASASFTDKLAGMGINLDSAKGIAASIIPGIVGKFVNKTNDPNDSSFDIKDIFSKISGPDGKFQLSDLTDLFSGNKAGEEGQQGGGVIDKLKGLFS